MMKWSFFYILFLIVVGCENTEEPIIETKNVTLGSLGLVGNTKDVEVETTSGIVLMGGGKDVDKAIQWMINKSGGGDFKIIRATGTNAYNRYVHNLAEVNSVETLLIDSRDLANNDEINKKILEAEAIFIAGGNQADYTKFWSNTALEETLQYLIEEKKIPIGGTSAGCAILGQYIFDAIQGTVYSDEAMNDPFINYVSLQENKIMQLPTLKGVITDTHYDNPDRIGRHLIFLARIKKDFNTNAKGIGIQEETAVCIEADGTAKVFGKGNAFFIKPFEHSLIPEILERGQPLTWGKEKSAINSVVIREIEGEYLDLNNWDNYQSSLVQSISIIDGKLEVKNE